ncbi:MAG TPA: MFS transporter, partial [Gammaproteobacteria bacterium]|jgi:MFS family permease|nr:MFS transporter [Gammaproteobacteria bacterium]
MESNKHFFVKAGPLLLVLFIDGMGLGLVIPVLNGLVFDPDSHFLPANSYSPFMYNVIYGSVIGIFMLCWFFGAAILGDLSDQIGRKKSLIICLVGAFLSYLLSAFSVSYHSLILFIIGRVVAGFTSGSQPIAQAAIIDLSTPKTKTRNIGYILLALSLGFIFGPLIGGVLADHRIVSWFNFSTPFYFASLISFLNIILLLLLFKETHVSEVTTFKIKIYEAVNIFISAFQHQKVRALSILFFLFIFGWSSFYSFISIYLYKIYDFNSMYISFYLTLMGVGFGLGNGFVANYFAKRFDLMPIFIGSTILTAALVFLMLEIPSVAFVWLSIAFISCFVSTAYVSILTLFSNQVDDKSQGWVMGITGSILAFVWGLNGITIGLLAGLDVGYPIYISAISLGITAILSFFVKL